MSYSPNRPWQRPTPVTRTDFLPLYLPRPVVPVEVVCGPPGSGKSTYVAVHASPDDLVLDVDVMAANLCGCEIYHADYNARIEAIRARNLVLRRLGKPIARKKVWLIVTAGAPYERDHWAAAYGPPTIMPTSKAECIARINADGRRPHEAKRRAIEAVREWE